MNITLFNRRYWIRRFDKQVNVRGYMTSGYKDMLVSLHVHPAGSATVSTLPEGERKISRLEAHGTDELVTADQNTGRKGDLLRYHGDWYECVSMEHWDHTLLSHLNYQFVIVPKDGSKTKDLDNPPVYDPSRR